MVVMTFVSALLGPTLNKDVCFDLIRVIGLTITETKFLRSYLIIADKSADSSMHKHTRSNVRKTIVTWSGMIVYVLSHRIKKMYVPYHI